MILWYVWPTRGVKPCFQPKPVSGTLTIANLWHDASSINKGSCMAAYCFSIFTFANFPDYNQIHIHSLVLTHFDSLKLFIITFVKSSILFPNLVLKVTCRVKANMPWTSKNGSSCHCYNKTFKTNFLQNDKR